MKVAVVGLWHLGSVTAACVAPRVESTVGWDPNPQVVTDLAAGKPPLFEPGLEEAVGAGLDGGRLRFTADLPEAVGGADVVWVTFDTPVGDDDRADEGFVEEQVRALLPHVGEGTVVLVSSQVPVGFCRRIEEALAACAGRPTATVACSPENLRLGEALAAFLHPERIVVGVAADGARTVLEPLLSQFSDNLLWMSLESAEMAKHALNAFLATSVAFINEVAVLGEQVGADASDVARALKSDRRIGPHAFLSPGGAFAGGTLARDVTSLLALADRTAVRAPLLAGVLDSNRSHSHWTEGALEAMLGGVGGRTVAVLGLAYKPGTDTLRRSAGLALCRWLAAGGAAVRAFDPAVKRLPSDVTGVELCGTAREAWVGADALVVATAWPQFAALTADELLADMATALVVDPGRALAPALQGRPGLEYAAVGMPR